MADLTSADAVLRQQLQDPEFRKHWERTALARAFGLWLLSHRVENGLSQRKLAQRLDMHQSAIARLESGDHAVRFETVQRILGRLNGALVLHITPESVSIENRTSEGEEESNTRVAVAPRANDVLNEQSEDSKTRR